jgi:hypothetical protein
MEVNMSSATHHGDHVLASVLAVSALLLIPFLQPARGQSSSGSSTPAVTQSKPFEYDGAPGSKFTILVTNGKPTMITEEVAGQRILSNIANGRAQVLTVQQNGTVLWSMGQKGKEALVNAASGRANAALAFYLANPGIASSPQPAQNNAGPNVGAGATALAPQAAPGSSPAAVAPAAAAAPNPVAENPNMGKLKKEGFMANIGHGVENAATGRTIIDRLSMRNILPQWDPNKRLSEQYPHIAITVLHSPGEWTDDYRDVLRKNNSLMPCFKLKAVVWLDATRSKTTDEFEWCINKDMFMAELQPTYLYSLVETEADDQTTGINRTDGPQPPDKLLPNDRATLDMEAKTNPLGASKDLNLDQNSLFAIMFANVRKDLGETLASDGDFRVWITTIKRGRFNLPA